MTTYIRKEMVALCDLLIAYYNRDVFTAGGCPSSADEYEEELKSVFEEMNIGMLSFDKLGVASIKYKNEIM